LYSADRIQIENYPTHDTFRNTLKLYMQINMSWKILKDGIVRNLKSMKGRQLNNQKKGTTRIPLTSRVRQLFPVLPVAPIVLNNERGKDAVL
jgi:hypothetical protein